MAENRFTLFPQVVESIWVSLWEWERSVINVILIRSDL